MISPLIPSLLLLGLLSAPAAWAQAPQQRLIFQVIQPRQMQVQSLSVEFSRLGRLRTVNLSDQGETEMDAPQDGIWMGVDDGDYVRMLDLTLLAARPGEQPRPILSETVIMDAASTANVAWFLSEGHSGLSAHRSSTSLPGGPLMIPERLPIDVVFGWLLFIGLLVLGLANLQRRGAPR